MDVLVLWDVDHTLIENGGVSKETYAGAFEVLTGRPAEHRAKTGGRTDPEILGDLIADHGLDPAVFDAAAQRGALTRALAERQERLADRGRALPGARAAIDKLATEPGLVQSALTGNLRANALVKLGTFGLDVGLDWDCGGFGFDAAHRPDLVAVAQARATAKYGVAFTASNTVLIGDTVNDVTAGVRGGAQVVAVLTGGVDEVSLTEAGATKVLPDLSDADAVLAAVRDAVRPPVSADGA
ncbi:HAD family hydrolase [Myceligenerans crystallogenes]|uniref:HAD family hydrolase n=1 Tax=Myceligenerans crystallogenes TaxID=316335 RepID=UPI0031E0669E